MCSNHMIKLKKTLLSLFRMKEIELDIWEIHINLLQNGIINKISHNNGRSTVDSIIE